jgi:hypothetical protein
MNVHCHAGLLPDTILRFSQRSDNRLVVRISVIQN